MNFRRPEWPLSVLLVAVGAVYWQAGSHDFISYDDPTYVSQNVRVLAGLTWENFLWAWRSTEASNWHPLTWLSHLVDVTLFGPKPGAHHLVNVGWHVANTGLVYLGLRRLTGAHWRSLGVAALFGLHPLHVESVAWIAERKDVLSTFFLLLALHAYACRAEALRTNGPGGRLHYWGCLGFFALGLLSKPMVVSLPCLLLLLDWWPLGRWTPDNRAAWRTRLVEKLPFFVLSAASCLMTLLAQGKGGAVASLQDFSLPVRLANAVVAYGGYLAKCFWPADLAVFYPHFAEAPPIWRVTLSCVILVLATIGVWRARRSRPYLTVGWLWFLGMLVPVIGLVQVGGQLLADRYTYVPLTGIFVMSVWLAGEVIAARPGLRPVVVATVIAVLVLLAGRTHRQLAHWRNDLTLFRHTVAVTENNYVAHANLFIALTKTSPTEAQVHFREMARILNEFSARFVRRGEEWARQTGREHEAIGEFRTAIRIKRDEAGPHYQLGLVLARTADGRAEAIAEFREALRFAPHHAEARYSLAYLLAETPGRTDEAINEYRRVLQVKPDYYEARCNLGILLLERPGAAAEARAHFEAAIAAQPERPEAKELLERLHRPSQR